MAVTVLQRIASTRQIGLLLVPAIKGAGALYINTHSNYSQPVLAKLYNENIGGHRYIFTVDSWCCGSMNYINIFSLLWIDIDRFDPKRIRVHR